MSEQPKRMPTKLDRERALYEQMGVRHPKDAVKDAVMEFRLRHLHDWLGKQHIGNTTRAGTDS
jgi:hypothetical protein